MKNKLDKEYLLDLYNTENVDNMIYALTMLRSLGLSEWFKNKNSFYNNLKIDVLIHNSHFIDMFDLNEFSPYYIYNFILNVDNGISYFNQKQLDKLEYYKINHIIKYKPELEKYLINCKNYEKQIR